MRHRYNHSNPPSPPNQRFSSLHAKLDAKLIVDLPASDAEQTPLRPSTAVLSKNDHSFSPCIICYYDDRPFVWHREPDFEHAACRGLRYIKTDICSMHQEDRGMEDDPI
jgi:hypothetical protein